MSRIVSPSGEIVGATKRRPMTTARRERIWRFSSGICYLCAGPVALAECEIEHRIQVWMGGADDDGGNTKPVHAACHKRKTAAEAPARAKVKRITGETGNGPKRPIQSRGFNKTLRRKFNGTVEVVSLGREI